MSNFWHVEYECGKGIHHGDTAYIPDIDANVVVIGGALFGRIEEPCRIKYVIFGSGDPGEFEVHSWQLLNWRHLSTYEVKP